MDLDTHIQQLRAGPRGPHIGAFFDFDGTLIDGYSALALFEHRLRNLEIGPLELFHTARLSLQGPLDEPAFQRLIEQGLSGWQGRPEEDILELGQQLFTQHIAGMLFHEAFRVVKAHQALGHTVVIATSATRMQVAPLAAGEIYELSEHPADHIDARRITELMRSNMPGSGVRTIE
mgnify:CR=1 FL=1